MIHIEGLVDAATRMGKEFERREILVRVRQIHPTLRVTSDDSLAATIAYHTVNMRSRFPNAGDPHKVASWMSEPRFYRTRPGYYRLLTSEEQQVFKDAIAKQVPLVFSDEWTLAELRRIPRE